MVLPEETLKKYSLRNACIYIKGCLSGILIISSPKYKQKWDKI